MPSPHGFIIARSTEAPFVTSMAKIINISLSVEGIALLKFEDIFNAMRSFKKETTLFTKNLYKDATLINVSSKLSSYIIPVDKILSLLFNSYFAQAIAMPLKVHGSLHSKWGS